jgi:hypothetical protein
MISRLGRHAEPHTHRAHGDIRALSGVEAVDVQVEPLVDTQGQQAVEDDGVKLPRSAARMLLA